MLVMKMRKPISPVLMLCAIILMMLVILFGFTLFLDVVPPKQSPAQRNLLTLFNSRTGETNSFLRLDRLSNEYFFVGAHGNTAGSLENSVSWIEDRRMKEVKYLNPYAAAQLVSKEKALRNLSPTLPILLLGCNTGTGSAPYAMEVSKYLSEDIYGVNGWLVVDQLGTSRTGQGGLISSYLNYGNFQTRRFRQGREIFD